MNVCLFWNKLADSPPCECGPGDEAVLYVLLRCDLYAEARKALQEAVGDRLGDASYLLGGWRGCKEARTDKFVDGPRESWKPDLKVVKASIEFSLPDWQTVSFFGREYRVRCWLISRVMGADAWLL